MKPTLFNLELQTYENDGNTIAEIDIDGVIGFDWWASEEEQNTKEKMRDQLRQINGIEADKIVVNISSLGGDVDHGLAIHDLLASNSAEVETRVIGMTASAATIIAQAGNTRSMSDNALYLVHRAWTIGMGNANDFEALAKDLNKLDDRISNIYAKRSDKDQSEFMDLMNESNGDGIWISAQEAKDFGLIDEINEPMKAAAMDASIFDKYEIPKPPENKQENISLDKEEYEQSDVDDSFTVRIGRNVIRGVLKKDDDVIHDEPTEAEKQKEFYERKKESSNEESANATSRERAFIEIAKSKYKYDE